MDRIEKKGYWWLPSNPNHQVAGTLVFGDSTSSELELLGTLRDDFEALQAMGNWREEHRPEIILGLCSEGVAYTLCNCLQSSGTFNTSSFLVETFRPTVVIEGKHFNSLNDIVFHHMTMRLSHLGDWYQRTGRSITFEEIDREKRKTTMTYQKAEELIVPFSGGKVEFGHDSRIKFARFSGDFSVSEEACVSVYPDTPLPMSEFLHEGLPPITHFISLGVGRSLTMKELRAKAAVDCTGATTEEIRQAPSLRLCWKKPPSEDADKELFSDNMVATCPDFGASLPAFLDAWV
ncbi:MAG: hypothetical protein RBU21_13505, partial [FCB group bacterium]|nr:hypothetical protein [FCB group bacterium]